MGQLQGWLEDRCSSQAEGEALYADTVLQGIHTWMHQLVVSFCELLGFQHHMAADKLACCKELLHLLRSASSHCTGPLSPRDCGCMASSCQAVPLQDVLCSAQQGLS